MTYRFDITADGTDAQDIIAHIGFRSFHTVTGYAVREAGALKSWEGERKVENRIILFWSNSNSAKDYVKFPQPLDVEDATQFLIYWLEMNQPAEDEPDVDGTIVKGFRVYNESWGHIENDHYAFLSLSPEWFVYGK